MTTMIDFTAWPKTPRLFHGTMTVTEKIDGTNSAVGILTAPSLKVDDCGPYALLSATVQNDSGMYWVYAQSRSRIVTPLQDNFGFAAWVEANAETLVADLGPGLHFGEWWGQGIQRRYGQEVKRFSLFNTHRFAGVEFATPNVDHVPVLGIGTVDTAAVLECMRQLEESGSLAAPGFMRPEGVCVFLSDVGRVLKVTFDGDSPKWKAAA